MFRQEFGAVRGRSELQNGAVRDRLALQNGAVFTLQFAPAGGGDPFAGLEHAGEMARRDEARGFGDFGDVQLGVPEHVPFGVLHPQVGNPVAERAVAGRLEVLREVGAVGAQRIGQLADGQPRAEVAVGGNPPGEPRRKVAVEGPCLAVRHLVRALRVVRSCGGSLLRGGELLLECLLDPLVEEQVVHVGAVEVDVEGDRRENPQEDVAVGQEGEQPAADAEDDGPPREDGHPADVGADVVGVGVVEEAHGAAVGEDKPSGQPHSVAYEPGGHHRQSRPLCRALGQTQQDDAREEREEHPCREVETQPAARDVEAVEQCGERRTEEPVAEEVGREVHQDGGVDVAQPYLEEEVDRIVGRQEQQRRSHDAPRAEVVREDGLVGGRGQQEVGAEEEHQRQGDAERIFVERKIHAHIGLEAFATKVRNNSIGCLRTGRNSLARMEISPPPKSVRRRLRGCLGGCSASSESTLGRCRSLTLGCRRSLVGANGAAGPAQFPVTRDRRRRFVHRWALLPFGEIPAV